MDTSLFVKTSIKGLSHKLPSTYLIDIRVDGKRSRKTVISSSLNEANQMLLKFKELMKKQNTIDVDIASTVEDYWQFLRKLKAWKPEHDNRMNLYYVRHIKRHLGKLQVIEVKPKHLTRFNLTLDGLSNRSRKTAYEILKPLFELAIEDELIERTPIKTAHTPVRNQLQEKKIITDASVKFRNLYQTFFTMFNSTKVIEKYKYQCSINPHNLALYLFGFHGRRLGEVLNLEWSDIDFANDTYIVKRESSKVKVDMMFKLPNDVRQALMKMDNTKQGRIFNGSNPKYDYATIKILSGLPEFTFHWMRNLVVSALASEGVDTTHLSAMLGHQETSTLKKYLSLQRESSTTITNQVTRHLLTGS